MSKVVLVKLCSRMAMKFPPTGLLYVGGALRKAGYEVELLHITPEEVQESVKKIVQISPLFVGFSVFTGDAMSAHAEMCREIKRLSRIPIVWGNVHPSLLPEQCLNESYIDVVVIGEGEVTAMELARALEGNGNLSGVLGIGYKVNVEVRINPPRAFITDLDQYSIDWNLVDVQRYLSPSWEMKRRLPLVTSRGCPYRCTFCYNIKFNLREWRSHSVDFVVTHIDELKKKYEVDCIFYHDDNFFVNKKRAFEILYRINLPYYAECRVEMINDNFVRQLAETGCKALLVGLESGSDRILKMIQKDSTVEHIYRAAEALSKYPSICLQGSTIMAYPTETREEINATLQMITRVFKIHPNTNFTTGFYLPYPGGELYDLAIKEGFSPPARTEDWELLDRWEAKLSITWNKAITSHDTSAIREHIIAMAFLNRYNVPFLKAFASWRLLKGFYGPLNLDLRLMNWIRRNFFGRYIKNRGVFILYNLLAKALRAIFGILHRRPLSTTHKP